MASNKAKRSFHLAQTQRLTSKSETAEALPVKAHVYRVIGEMNTGFETAIQSLQSIQRTNFIRSEKLASIHDLICGIRAQTNRELMSILNEREIANAAHFDRPCGGSGFERFRATETQTVRNTVE